MAELVLKTCPPGHIEGPQRRARAALGRAPTVAEVEQALPAGTTQIDATEVPLASSLRVQVRVDGSPALPAPLLAGFARPA